MDPKLKKYLEKEFLAIRKNMATKSDLKILDKKIEDKTADILEVVRSTGDNTSRIITRIDNDYSYLRQHVDHIFKRVDYLEKKLLK
ncbi:MAG: hypothetical protein AABY15_01460 [Nanoarchaeota archaeon]